MLNKDAFQGSLFDFAFPQGHDLPTRLQPLHDWVQTRRDERVWPFSRVGTSKQRHVATVANECGDKAREYVNFGSQDYLGLGGHPAIIETAKSAIDEYGVHSGGSAIVSGRSSLTLELEARIATAVGMPCATIYPTGWAAGFGVIQGLVQFYDTVIIDALAHSCLREGARHASRRVREFRHNDLDDLERLLREQRREAESAIFVVVESLYSMDSDGPELPRLLDLIAQYNAILIIDVAHDFGCLGPSGRGLLETIELCDDRVVVMGAFSKAFASNGGFVASHPFVKEQLAVFSAPFTFSSALCPIQSAIGVKACEIIFSDEGRELRERLLANIRLLRNAMQEQRMEVRGHESPIVPVFVGDEALARATARMLLENGLLANLAEYPGVPHGAARFRFQVMSTHQPESIRQAAQTMRRCRDLASQLLADSGIRGESR